MTEDRAKELIRYYGNGPEALIAAYRAGVEEERERCLEICDNFDDPSDLIRRIFPEQGSNTGAPQK